MFSAIHAMVYKVTTMTLLLLMGENCVISGAMHFVFRLERDTLTKKQTDFSPKIEMGGKPF